MTTTPTREPLPCSYRLRRARDIVVLMLPIHTVSEPNVRGHWSARAGRAKDHRSVVGLTLRPQLKALGLPVTVLLTRFSSGRLDDDNLRGALKAVRDGVADALGLANDSDPRVTWCYSQTRAKRGAHGVEVTVSRGVASLERAATRSR